MLKLKPLIAAKAKENLVTHTKNGYKQLCQNSDNPVDTKKELSKLAGVSHDTISRIEKIAAKAKENQQIHGGTAPGKTLSQNSAKVIDTRKELSKLAGVSHDTISRIEKIAAKAKENQGQRTDLTSGRILPNVFRESVYLFLKACNLGVITYSVMISPYKL